jgi:radical SAM/Cys-rich protein
MNIEPSGRTNGIESFSSTLQRFGVSLEREKTITLQVNVGRLCDLACPHCHHNAGPGCGEVMNLETMKSVVEYAKRTRFEVIDITGGAPELVPHIGYLVSNLAQLATRLLFRTNLTAMYDHRHELPELLKRCGAEVVASFPSLNSGHHHAQRGDGVLAKSLLMLKLLNGLGYGCEESGLLLDLVVNPGGAFLPADQHDLEKKFRRDLSRKEGIVFNNLFTLANVPLGRFRQWLERSGNLEQYMAKLATSFNPTNISGLMCRTQAVISWDGCLYDCDFNVATGQCYGGQRRHVSEMAGAPSKAIPIATGEHCYACTAGAGSSCGGAIAA